MSIQRGLRNRIEECILKHQAEIFSTPSKPLSFIEVCDYIQSRDKSLLRTKRDLLLDTVEAVCRALQKSTLSDKQPCIEIVGDSSDEKEASKAATEQISGDDLQTESTVQERIVNGSKSSDLVNKRRDKPSLREGRSKRLKMDNERLPPKDKSMADLGGVDACINEVMELIVLPLTHPELFTYTGLTPPRGVLLHGPPGCGKTMLANAIAGELGMPFICKSAPELVSGMSGESEKKVRDLFEEARALAPCLLFIDEIDAVTPKRENAQREMERRIVAQLLTCIDDLSLEKTDGKPVMVIGATNRPDSIDPALRRAGRFDREICMGVPDEKAREEILHVLCKNLTLSDDLNFKILARMTPGFVGADLSALIAAAGVVAIKRIFGALKAQTTINSIEMDTEDTDMAQISQDAFERTMESGAVQESGESHTTIGTSTVLSPIKAFLNTYPNTLSATDMAPLSISYDDFLRALPGVQPSSKREGFTTVPDVSWEDIGALQSVRMELQMAIVQPIKCPEFFAHLGIVAPAGVLLWGPPGCGKTLLAKAVAKESQANFISIRGPELLNKYVGESEKGVRDVFARARASNPCVIFFDELDSLIPRRDDSLSESSSRVVNTLLTELDGNDGRKGVFVIATTNRPDMIDPAVLRPGRLDKTLFIELPTPAERGDILKTLTKKTPISSDVDLAKVALDDRCTNFSGADLAALVREAAVAALRSTIFQDLDHSEVNAMGAVPHGLVVTEENFNAAFDKVKPSVSDSQRDRYRKTLEKFK